MLVPLKSHLHWLLKRKSVAWNLAQICQFEISLRKNWGTRDQIGTICWIIQKAREFQRNIYLCIIDYAKAFDCIDHDSEIFLKRWEYQTTLPASWKTCIQVKKQQLEPDIEKWTGFKLGQEYVRTVYCHPAYLMYM